jgi:hypothetical protein
MTSTVQSASEEAREHDPMRQGEPYFFQGVVHPERAQISEHRVVMQFLHPASATMSVASVSIILNQVAVWVQSEYQWEAYDLRNVVRSMLEHELAMLGYLTGYAFEVEVTRIIHRGRDIDHVFGIGTPCIMAMQRDVEKETLAIRHNVVGADGRFLSRCLSDLVSALKRVDDTAFYCYRALESLRHHCASVRSLIASDKDTQWRTFRDSAKCSEETIREIKVAADGLRHGEPAYFTDAERAKLLTQTWTIVSAYLSGLPVESQATPNAWIPDRG